MSHQQKIQNAQKEVDQLKARMLKSGRDPKEVALCIKDVIKGYPKNISIYLNY